ncbi:ribosome recycling factor [candidate division TA06 bacterium DG_24]|uniref:Ribosome-recycling factor n=1 Tax=candidate division TA06 bacterium DG_24 TaxID=1703770 RepID=A0A0S7WVV9_UNCT6|nr:MAG: ribosome recycling factor [candidate division TA06 bacterium DG_24]
MFDPVFRETKAKMEKSVEAVGRELAGIRTGKATTTLLDGIKVDYYGSQVALSQVAGISVPEMRLLVIQPWDKSIIPEIERALHKSDLGLTPSNDGNIVRVPIPPLTEERRKELVRVVRKLAEEGRIAARNIRRDANDALKKMEKTGEISRDEEHRWFEKIQDLTDKTIEEVDALLLDKEKEIMEV